MLWLDNSPTMKYGDGMPLSLLRTFSVTWYEVDSDATAGAGTLHSLTEPKVVPVVEAILADGKFDRIKIERT